MSRADVRTFAWLLPLALALVLGWMFRADPCLDEEIARNWDAQAPRVVEPFAATPVDPDIVVVENPYGLESCHPVRNGFEEVATIATLFVIVLFLGFLCARNFERHAGRRAAVIVLIALVFTELFALLTYFPDYFQSRVRDGSETLLREMSTMLAVACAGAAMAWLAAKLTLRWRPRG